MEPQEQDSAAAEQLASDLGREVGAERGGAILELARAHALCARNRRGSATSEFKVAALLILGGLGMIGLGTYTGDGALVAQGTDLAKIVGAGYAVSRGIAKKSDTPAKEPAP
ncbi:MAG: hypothetical protein GY716_16145 [bacterium]|nr:hypothetical protein [bacterium]